MTFKILTYLLIYLTNYLLSTLQKIFLKIQFTLRDIYRFSTKLKYLSLRGRKGGKDMDLLN